jgi:hypothetical protein
VQDGMCFDQLQAEACNVGLLVPPLHPRVR